MQIIIELLHRIPHFDRSTLTPAVCDTWLAQMNACGLLYHLDDAPAEIISGSDMERVFSELECTILGGIVPKILELEGYDPFEICCQLSDPRLKTDSGRTTVQFSTSKEAEAFAAGIEYVNDSSIRVESFHMDANGKYCVVVLDEDQSGSSVIDCSAGFNLSVEPAWE